MEIIADTNVLVRAIVADDPNQAEAAQQALLSASIVAISHIALCELYWVLSRAYIWCHSAQLFCPFLNLIVCPQLVESKT